MRIGAFSFVGFWLLLTAMVHASNDTLALEEEVEEGDDAGDGEGLMLEEVEGDQEQQEVEGEDEEEEDLPHVNLEDNIVDTGRRRGIDFSRQTRPRFISH